MTDSFRARQSLRVRSAAFEIYRLDAVDGPIQDLPYTLKILLENLLRHEDGENIIGRGYSGARALESASRARAGDRASRPRA